MPLYGEQNGKKVLLNGTHARTPQMRAYFKALKQIEREERKKEPISITELAMKTDTENDPLALQKLTQSTDGLFFSEEDKIHGEERQRLLIKAAMITENAEDLRKLRKLIEDGKI